MKTDNEDGRWTRRWAPEEEAENEWLSQAELDWIALQAETPELADPILFFLPQQRGKDGGGK